MRVEGSIEINRSLQEVFDYVSDVDHYPEWMAHVLEVLKDTPGRPQQGDRFIVAIKSLGRRFETPYERISYEAGRGYTDRAVGGPIPNQQWRSTLRGYRAARASREPCTLSPVAYSNCWNRFRSGQPSGNFKETWRR